MVGYTGFLKGKINYFDRYLISYTKSNYRWIIDLSVKNLNNKTSRM